MMMKWNQRLCHCFQRHSQMEITNIGSCVDLCLCTLKQFCLISYRTKEIFFRRRLSFRGTYGQKEITSFLSQSLTKLSKLGKVI